ncbi:MAG: hypothetical protein NTZ18_03935 [Candidatus Komeilibacteria bacterium]|nr:hypothetical protein [Candidatus Komeilibacteria bacterium]
MISLNLISPQQQHYLKIRYGHVLIKNFLGVLIILSVALAIVSLPLQRQLNNLEINNAAIKKSIAGQNQETTQKISVLNQKILDLTKITVEAYNWNRLLLALAAAAPQDVALSDFSANLSSADFTLKGYAKTREGLIAFKDNLDKAAVFSNIQSPLENYLEKQNITFSISGKIK